MTGAEVRTELTLAATRPHTQPRYSPRQTAQTKASWLWPDSREEKDNEGRGEAEVAAVSAYLSSLEDPLGLAVEVEVSPESPPQDVGTDAKLPGIQSGKVPDPVDGWKKHGSSAISTQEDSSSGLISFNMLSPRGGMTLLVNHTSTHPKPHPSRAEAKMTLPSSGEKYSEESSASSSPVLQS